MLQEQAVSGATTSDQDTEPPPGPPDWSRPAQPSALDQIFMHCLIQIGVSLHKTANFAVWSEFVCIIFHYIYGPNCGFADSFPLLADLTVGKLAFFKDLCDFKEGSTALKMNFSHR